MKDQPRTTKSTQGYPANLKAAVFSAVIIAIWSIGASGFFKAQLKGMGRVPELLRLGYDEKRLDLEGPVYILAAEARRIIPENSSIYLYNPSENAGASYFYLKLRYSLYPRKIKDARARINADEIAKSDYLMFFIPPETKNADIKSIEENAFLKKVFEYASPGGYMAAYRVERGLP